MAMNIIELVKNSLGDDFGRAAAGVAGLSPDKTRSTVSAAIPAILAGLVGSSSTNRGRSALASALDDATDLSNQTYSFSSDSSDRQSLMGSGIDMLTSLLGGGKVTGLANALGGFAGIAPGAANSLIGMLAPMILGVLGREQRASNLDVDGVVQMLQSQKSEIASALPSGLSSALASNGLLEGFGDITGAATRTKARAARSATKAASQATHTAPRRRNWMLIAATVAVLAIVAWALNRGPDETAGVEPARQAAGVGPGASASLMVGNVDVGRQFDAIADGLSETMGSVRDEASAAAALPQLSELNQQLGDLTPLMDRLPSDARQTFDEMARSRVSSLQNEAARIESLSNVPQSVRATVSSLQDRLADIVA